MKTLMSFFITSSLRERARELFVFHDLSTQSFSQDLLGLDFAEWFSGNSTLMIRADHL
jgi:hypothetical protein